MDEIDAILLAAGQSRRMGAANKLLLDWHGEPMIRHVAQTYLDAIGPNVHVITGFEQDAIRDALSGLPLRFHHNPAYETGQQTSVIAGLNAASDDKDLLIGLGDQPLLTAGDLTGLCHAHAAKDPGKISIPHNGKRRGNPILVPATLRARLLADGKQPGCKRFTRENPDLVQELPLTAPGFFIDVDTPDAYENYRKGASHETAVSAY